MSHPRLSRLSIKGFRGVDSLDLSFEGPDGNPSRLAVIAGPNGSGKTTVLEAGLIASGQSKMILGTSGKQAIRAGSQDYVIQAEFKNNGDQWPSEHRSASSISLATIPCSYFSSWRAPKLVGPLPVNTGKKGKRPYLTEENRLWIIKQFMINAKFFASVFPRSSPEPSQYDQLIAKVDEIWGMFYPDSKEVFSVEASGNTPDEGFDVFLNRKDGVRVCLDALSAGQLELFMLAGSMLPSDQQEDIVFMDEPELHLDPQWHRLILRAMLKLRPNSQFIVGTHSPEIYESVMSFERHFLLTSNDIKPAIWEKKIEGTVAV